MPLCWHIWNLSDALIEELSRSDWLAVMFVENCLDCWLTCENLAQCWWCHPRPMVPGFIRMLADPDMALGSNLVQDITMTLMAGQAGQYVPQTPTCFRVADHTPGIHTAGNGNGSQGHQLTPWLLQGHLLRMFCVEYPWPVFTTGGHRNQACWNPRATWAHLSR